MSIEAAFFGALGRDAELKTSKGGKAYLRINVRVGDGDKAQWINVTVFDPDTIEIADKMLKGARIYIEGKLSLDEWTAQDGGKRTSLSCMSWHCRLAEIGRHKSKRQPKSEQKVAAQYTPSGSGPAFNDEIPFVPEVR
jgi:single-strand DNA-binding protein